MWNGTNYATPIAESQEVEPYALGWLLTLTTISELLERQRSEPSRAQLDYVERELFGGIGSLTDFDFRSRIKDANATEQWEACRSDAYKKFEQLKRALQNSPG